MTPRLSGHFSIFGLVFFLLKSPLGISRQWSFEKFAILTLKPRIHVRILIYLTWAVGHLHDGVVLLLRPQSFSLSNLNFVIPARFK